MGVPPNNPVDLLRIHLARDLYLGGHPMRRAQDEMRTPYSVDLSPLRGALSSLPAEIQERVENQLGAIAELAAIMPPPVPLRGLGASYDAYSLRVDDFTVFYAVDPIRRCIQLRDVSRRPPKPKDA